MKIHLSRIRSSRRGTILIVTMAITFLLAGMVLVFCRSMRVEAIASSNQVSSVSASAIERGAEQYSLAMVDQLKDQVYLSAENLFYGVQLGDGYFWLIRPNYDDESLPVYGFTDEAGKLNINSASLEMLLRLPGMTDDIAAAIMDWRDDDSDTSQGMGAENEYYLSLPQPYYCKNAPFEATEELLLVRGVTVDLMYGENYFLRTGMARDVTANSANTSMTIGDPSLARGIYDLVTCFSAEPTTATTGTSTVLGRTGGNQPAPKKGLININNAPRDVLYCLPDMEISDVDTLVSARYGAQLTAGDTSWAQQALANKYGSIAPYISGNSYTYSADIVAVAGNGRAFKHVRIVIDARTSPAKIVYRKDLTDQGWPMDPATLQSLRSGHGVPAPAKPLQGGSL